MASILLNDIPREIIRDRVAKHCSGDKTESGCVLWRGQLAPNGYGRIYIAGRTYSAHRAIWVLHKSGVAANIDVCHACDNRQCVNIEHLFLGTRSENMVDASRKERLHFHVSPSTMPRGERHGEAKLTLAEVMAIRSINMPQRKIAKLFGVHQATICRVKNGTSWQEYRSLKSKPKETQP